ncbi:MAG: hypothetical protein RLZ44_1446 [Pseudomonadota bacterium]|jgi:hypothetical protein
MSKHTAVRIKGSLWEAIAQRAAQERLSPEAWLQRQLGEAAAAPATPSATSDDLLLDLAVRHFRELELTAAEAGELAAAILHTVATAEPCAVGPVGAAARRYVLQRRVAAVSIQVGEGRMRLPLPAALQLAATLQRMGEPGMLSRIAA